ncbi:arginine--tRNA ligase [Thermogymnomonas acidicola]|uniref:Arginine--tRNA ligase n=1 Tax=Thermogymnomonas acidicola TaxID=399579 RepID=A0AA37BQP2_9ARCH|nr:arginine--tRNA ligase [Thermogymnomonas acidicola]GGM70685.1 arginine--tRNA ligase [Thermogymnomonas acidicola]
MLLFDDFLDRVVKIVTDRFPSFDPRDVSFDNTGRADLAIRTFRLSSKLGIDPRSVFASLEPALKSQKFVEKVVLEGAYINITLDPWSMLSTITESIERSGRFPDVFQESEKVSVEHTSTNPTGPLHIGRARNSIIGDTLQRVLKRYGYRVTTQYFVNDSGKQVMALYLGYTKYGSGEKTLQEILRCYQAIYRDMEKDPQVEREVEALIRRYEEGDRELIEGIKSTAKVALDDISSSMRAIGIEIDDYTWESDFITGGDVKRIIENNREKLQSDDDGALFVQVPGGKRMYLTRKDGTSLYPLRDVAYHMYKAGLFDWFVVVVGEDHRDHAKGLEYILREIIGLKQRISFVFNAYVSLETGKMSTRRGNIVTLQQLTERMVEEAYSIVKEKRPDLGEEKLREIARAVGVSSLRFNMVRIGATKPMVFRWSEALNFEGDSAPFIMYAGARASSLLRKASRDLVDFPRTFNEDERRLIREMYRFPYVLSEAKETLRGDLIASYSLDLVKVFNEFYNSCQILNASDAEYSKRITLVRAFRSILMDLYDLLGVIPVEEM